jgi:hypothetical protein
MSRPNVLLALLVLLAPAPLRAQTPAATPSAKTPEARTSQGDDSARASAGAPELDPEQIAELRSAVPPPLLWGRLRPEVGAFVVYELTAGKRKTEVRGAVVNRITRNGLGYFQVEFSFKAEPRTLVIAYVSDEPQPQLERLVLWMPPRAPVSVPLDLPLEAPGLRGERVRQAPAKAPAPFTGEARRVHWTIEEGTVEVTEADAVPLFGVARLRTPSETWVAKRAGTGATTELTAVPIMVPRIAQ